MKIVVAVPFLSNGGGERALFNLAVYFNSIGHSVTIIASCSIMYNNMQVPPGIKLFTLGNNEPLTNTAFIYTAKKISPILKDIEPDIVLSTSDYLNIGLLIVKKIINGKFKIIVSHQYHTSSLLKELPFKNKLFIQLLQKIIAKQSNAVVCCSQGVADDYLTRYNILRKKNKLHVIYNPIYEEQIIIKAQENVSGNYFKNDTYNIITVARFVPQKNLETLIRAFGIFIKKNHLSKLFIVGKGPDEHKLKTLANSLDLTDSVVFLGYQENPYAFVAQSNLFVLSSIYEGFGNVLVEAMAVGTNVVATNCPSGPSEIIENGKYGYLSQVGNATMLAQKIEQALANPLPKEVLINRAKEFSIQKSGDQYLCLMQSLLKRN